MNLGRRLQAMSKFEAQQGLCHTECLSSLQKPSQCYPLGAGSLCTVYYPRIWCNQYRERFTVILLDMLS